MAQETPLPEPPKIAEASDEAQNAMQLFLLPDGVSASLFAAEPNIANPVAIDVDLNNRVFVCESYRQENGIEDNRNHPEWLLEDLAATQVVDRLAYIKKHLGEGAIEYTRQDDRIRLLTDRDGDGAADHSVVYADRFNRIQDGTGAGVLSIGSKVFYTCIPDLWLLADTDGNGTSDSRRSLHSGFGVRFAFRGHDLHGLIVGPDGRLYFSVGDRGYNVPGISPNPESGAVFRCELDGSKLEVVATGLRNPQELAFDNDGNLFTGDNNSDSGDKARMVYVVDGSDSGWRMSYQYLPDRGPFNREKIWHPYSPEHSPACIVPPIDNFADGPSGFAFYPGSGFSDHMNERFLLCDFRGQTSGSGIKTFRLKPKGAFFEIVDEENTFWNLLATDCCFGPDGRLYISDWVHGWDGIGKGRIYALSDDNANIELKRTTQSILSGDWGQLSTARLVDLLGHRDRRVRQQAQFSLVERQASFELEVIARSASAKPLARMHALWGLEQLFRFGQSDDTLRLRIAMVITGLIDTEEPRVARVATRLTGEVFGGAGNLVLPREPALEKLARQISEGDDPLKFHAVMALGKAANGSGLEFVQELLTTNQNQDPLIRHAGIMAMVYQCEQGHGSWIADSSRHTSSAVRLAAVVAARKVVQRGGDQSAFPVQLIQDVDQAVSLEAARAVYDLPMPEHLHLLAQRANETELNDPAARRILNANYRLGDTDSLNRVLEFASDDSQSMPRRVEAVEMLAAWADPPVLDRVLGMHRPMESSGRSIVAEKAVALLFREFEATDDRLKPALIDAAIALQVDSAVTKLLNTFDTHPDFEIRTKALEALFSMNAADPEAVIDRAMNSDQSGIRILGLNYLVQQRNEDAVGWLRKAIESASTAERQNAINLLGTSRKESHVDLLDSLLENLDSVNRDSQLDVLLAANRSIDSRLKSKVQDRIPTADDRANLDRFEVALYGGNAERGSRIFFERTDVSCLRCHKIKGSGGDVGPDLSDIGSKRERSLILESLIQPNKTITENFETVVVQDVDGKMHVGVKKESTDEMLSIMTADAILVNIPVEDIEQMRGGDSAMPDDVTKHLTISEIRDLVEFLARQTSDEQDSRK